MFKCPLCGKKLYDIGTHHKIHKKTYKEFYELCKKVSPDVVVNQFYIPTKK
jgi:hypothetical protein